MTPFSIFMICSGEHLPWSSSRSKTIQNKKRLETRDAESRALMLNNLKETANDPVRARNFLLKTSMIEALRRSEKLMLNGET